MSVVEDAARVAATAEARWWDSPEAQEINLHLYVAHALADAGLLARPLPETTTEWAARGVGIIVTDYSERHARAAAKQYGGAVVRREVTAWTEADR